MKYSLLLAIIISLVVTGCAVTANATTNTNATATSSATTAPSAIPPAISTVLVSATAASSPIPTAGATTAPNATPSAPTAAQDCGTVHMQGPNPPRDATAQQAENCFWAAFQKSQSAKLVVTIMGVDTVETHTLSLGKNGAQVVIADAVDHTIVPARTMPTQTYACSSLRQNQGGLQFVSCGDEGDFLVPAPAK